MGFRVFTTYMKLTSSSLPKEIQDTYKKNKEFDQIEKVDKQHSGMEDVYVVRLFNGLEDKWIFENYNWKCQFGKVAKVNKKY